jgi:hypothetical protein
MPDKPMQKRLSLKRASLMSVEDSQTSPAAYSNDETKVLGPDEPEEMPLPSDPKVIFLGGLFTLALLAAAYEVGVIVWPFVFAFVLQLRRESNDRNELGGRVAFRSAGLPLRHRL